MKNSPKMLQKTLNQDIELEVHFFARRPCPAKLHNDHLTSSHRQVGKQKFLAESCGM